MKKILSFGVLINLAYFAFGQSEKIKFVKSTDTAFILKIDTIGKFYTTHQIEVTLNSLKIDNEDMIIENCTENCTLDSIINRLLNLELGKLLTIKKEGYYENYQTIITDSILCGRFATIGISLTSKHNVDSIFKEISDDIQKGHDWNKLKYHMTDINFDSKNQIKGLSKWLPISELIDVFKTEYFNHNIGDVFLVKYPKFNFAWIVKKITNEKYFKRSTILATYPN